MQSRMRIVCLFVLSAALAFAALPRVTSVEPDMAQPGDGATAYGSSLDQVAKLFLTVGDQDIPVEIQDRKADEIRFVLPADLAHGMYRLTVQTGGESPAIMVQPISIEVADAAAIQKRKKDLEEPPPAAEPPAETPK